MAARTTAQRPSVLMRALSGAAGQKATPQGTRSLTAANAGEYASNAREPAADFLSTRYIDMRAANARAARSVHGSACLRVRMVTPQKLQAARIAAAQR
ncbi:hypothetical protein [Xanthomonas graminis]|uniref:hypothetical protein n=1 Tax=Xanthomonas graminis TaxID=3390026 RepID=UPI001BAF3571|nr:hypothetical protein [Xanthomonas translucens]